MDRITVLVADSQLMVSDALAMALRQWPRFNVLDDLPLDALDAVDVAVRSRPDVAVLDYWLGGMDAWAVVQTILQRTPTTRILHTSWFHGPTQVQDSLSSGAVGFIPKGLRVAQLKEAIERAYSGEQPVFAAELERLVGRISERGMLQQRMKQRMVLLTPRELEVLRLMAAGLAAAAIAKKLNVKPQTVRNHIHSIFEKTGTGSHAEVVARARDLGLVV